MSNENLKNELNKLPQEFDREQLWSSIELPKKKKKRRGFYWIFVAGIVLLGILLFTISDLNNSPQPPFAKDKKMLEHDSNIAQKVNEKKPGLLSKTLTEENYKSSSFQTTENFKLQKKTNTNSENTELKNDLDSYENQRISASRLLNNREDNSDESRSTDHLPTDEKKSNELSVENEIFSDEPKLKYDNSIYANQENLTSSILRNRIKTFDLIKMIQPLPHIAIEPLEIGNMKVDKEYNFSVPNSYHDRPFSYSLSIFSLIGKSDHDFASVTNSKDREEAEKPLESISVGIIGHKHLNDFELFTGISYTRHNTLLTRSVQDFLIIDNLQSLIQREVNTQYSLYNSYQYIDLFVGFGYNLALGNRWSVTPSIQIGYSLNFSPDGEIIVQDNLVIELAELNEYKNYSKWQGQANLKVARRIGENWEIGLLGFLTTRKSLAEFDDYNHKVSSYGVGLSISRLIK